MGRLVMWTKRRGWEVGPTPYWYHLDGLHLFQRLRFKGLRTTRRFRRSRKGL